MPAFHGPYSFIDRLHHDIEIGKEALALGPGLIARWLRAGLGLAQGQVGPIPSHFFVLPFGLGFSPIWASFRS